MNASGPTAAQQDTIRRLKEVRAEALKHFRIAQDLARERRDLIRGLTEEGVSQAEIARDSGCPGRPCRRCSLSDAAV